jgi:hypothetical protein
MLTGARPTIARQTGLPTAGLWIPVVVVLMVLGLVQPSSAAVNRWYGIRIERNLSAYTGAAQTIPHLTIGGPLANSSVRMACGNNVAGEGNMALLNLWSIWRRGTARVDGRWMEMSAEYFCPQGGVRTKRIRYEWYWDANGRISYFRNINDVNRHWYEIYHHHGVGHDRWYWRYDGSEVVGYLTWNGAHAPHATENHHGLEISNNVGITVVHHEYGLARYKTRDDVWQWTDASWDARRTDWRPVGDHAPNGRTLHACVHFTNNCH